MPKLKQLGSPAVPSFSHKEEAFSKVFYTNPIYFSLTVEYEDIHKEDLKTHHTIDLKRIKLTKIEWNIEISKKEADSIKGVKFYE